MSLNFKDFIDAEEHAHKTLREVYKIKNEHSRAFSTPKDYLDDISDFFIKDIENISHQIYQNVLLKKNTENIKFTTPELKKCIIDGTTHFRTLYESEIKNYNIGGLIRNYGDIQKYTNSFTERSETSSKKQSELICSKYCKNLKENSYSFWLLTFAIVAAVSATIAVIPLILQFLKYIIPIK